MQAKRQDAHVKVDTSYGLFVVPEVIQQGDEELGVLSKEQLEAKLATALEMKAEAQKLRKAWDAEEDEIKDAAQGNVLAMQELDDRARAEHARKTAERLSIMEEKRQAEARRKVSRLECRAEQRQWCARARVCVCVCGGGGGWGGSGGGGDGTGAQQCAADYRGALPPRSFSCSFAHVQTTVSHATALFSICFSATKFRRLPASSMTPTG